MVTADCYRYLSLWENEVENCIVVPLPVIANDFTQDEDGKYLIYLPVFCVFVFQDMENFIVVHSPNDPPTG